MPGCVSDGKEYRKGGALPPRGAPPCPSPFSLTLANLIGVGRSVTLLTAALPFCFTRPPASPQAYYLLAG